MPFIFFNALDVHRGSGIPKALPTGVTHRCLMAFFAIELTQGPDLRFPNLHFIQPLCGPSWGRLVARLPRRSLVKGLLGVGGRSWPSATVASGLFCAPHTKMVFVPCQEGEEQEGGDEEELVEDPNGVSIEQGAQCLLSVGTTTGHFLLSGWSGGRQVPPLVMRSAGGGGGRRPPQSMPLGHGVPWGGTGVAHLARACWD